MIRLGVDAWNLPGDHRVDRLALVRDDHDEDIRHHDRADNRADLGKGAEPAEDMREAVSQRDKIDIADQSQRHLVLAERRAAQTLIDKPRQHQAAKGDARGLQIRDERTDPLGRRSGHH